MQQQTLRRYYLFFTSILFFGFLSGCQLIADYDQTTVEQLTHISKKVDTFYLELSYSAPKQREYAKYRDKYLAIEADLRALKRRQEVRAMNKLTLEQVEIALKFWQEDRQNHMKKQTVSNFIIKRRQKPISTSICCDDER